MNTSLRTSLFWDYFNRFGNTAFSLITSIILARLLTPADYGLVGISMAVNGIAGIFLNLGFVSAIIQAPKLDNKSLSTVFYLNIGIAFVLYLIIYSLAPWVSQYYKLEELKNILRVTSVSFLFNALSIVPTALLTKAMRFKQIAILSLISSILGGFIGILMAFKNYGVWSIVTQQLVFSSISLIGIYFITKWWPILYFKISSIKAMLSFGVYMFLSGFLEGIYSKIDIFLIAKVFSPASLGLYTRAQGLDSTIRSLTSSSLLNVLFPTFAKIRDDKEQLVKLYYQYFELISFLFCFLAGIFYLISEKLFLVMFGAQWITSAVYFKILVIAGFAYPLSSLSLSIIEARGNSKNFFKVEIIKKIIGLPCYFIAYFFGIIPFLISYVVALFIATIVNIKFLTFELPISIIKTIKVLCIYFMSLLIIVNTIESVFYINKFTNSYFNICIQLAAFIVMYLGLHYKTKSKAITSALNLFYK